MAMYYKGRQSVLKTKDGKNLWYPQLVKAKTAIDIDRLAAVIADKSSLTKGDVKNVLENLSDTLALFLMNSMSVNIANLGTFTAVVNASGAGVETEEEVSSKQIRSLKIRFTPSYKRSHFNGTTRSMYRDVVFEKYDATNSKLGDIETDPDGNGGGGIIDPDA